MVDERIKKIADILVNYSIKVKKGSNILISFTSEANDLVSAIESILKDK